MAAVVLIAVWMMKRWAVLALVAYALANAIIAMPHYFAATPRSLPVAVFFAALIVAFRNVALIPAVVYWRRMTWR